MSFTICRAHMVHYFLNGTGCPSLPRLCRKRRALRSSSSYQALLLLLLPWRYPPVSWGKPQQAWRSDWSTASWQVQVEWSARRPKCSAGSSDRLTDSWFRNSWGWGSAAPNWRGSCRFWLTGVIMDSGRAADTPAVIMNSKYLANFFSAFLFLPSSRLWSSSGTLFGSAAHSPCV